MPADPRQQRALLGEAAHWYARLCAEDAGDSQRQAWLHWCAQSPEHRWAWQRVEALQAQLRGVSGNLAYDTLNQPRGLPRRSLLKGALLLAGSAALGGTGYRYGSQAAWLADYRTGIGERRQVRLADGSRLTLDTASAVDLRFDAGQRLVLLRKGAVLIETAHDSRPFLLDSAEGRLHALGTRFCVRQEEGCTRLAVLRDAVAVQPFALPGQQRIVQAGQQLRFGAAYLGQPERAAAGAASWADGWLVVDAWRLDALLAELGRYRPGVLGCDPAVAGLRLSGAYPLDEPEQALQAVARALPVRLRRFTDYWVRVVPA